MCKIIIGDGGRLTLPDDVLVHLGVRAGGRIDVVKRPNGVVETSAARATGHISDVFGMLKRDGGPVLTIEEINEAAAKGWAGEVD